MKTLKPLAAALLLIGSSASAQLLNPGAGSGFSLTGNAPAPYSFSLPSAVDDVVFKCGTPPYIPCTDVHMNKREAIRIAGRCPEPAIQSCIDFLMKNSPSSNPAETIAAYTPPPGTQWASPDCTHIPCRLADSPGTGATESGLPYDQQPGFIGPPAPPKNNLPPAFDAKDFQKELAEARADNQYPIVDLGDNRYGVVLDNGTVSVCGRGQCTMPRPAAEFPDLPERLQAAQSLNSGAGSINNDNPGGFSLSSNKQTPDLNNAGRTAGGSPAVPDTSASDEARGFGEQAANDSAAISGTAGGLPGADSGGTSVASNGGGAAGGTEEVIKTRAEALGSIEITYSRLQKTEADIKGAAGAFNSGAMTGFASPNAPAPANGRLAEPPVDEKYLGKIQAASNE